MARELMKGNEAIAEAAIRAGLQGVFWVSHYTTD